MIKFRDFFHIFPTVLVGYLVCRVIGSGYEVEMRSVDTNLWQLEKQITELQTVAQTNGHYDVQELCEGAKESLEKARSIWEKLVSNYAQKLWLASDSSYKTNLDNHWWECGFKLDSLYQHPRVLPSNSSYSQPVQACKVTFEMCKSSFETVWKCSPPSPTPSGSQHKRRVKNKRDSREMTFHSQCPLGETACPISANSNGHECIDVQSELTSCGGCVSKNEGVNCMKIPGAAGVGCQHGKCLVFSVQPSYFLGRDGVPRLRRRRMF